MLQAVRPPRRGGSGGNNATTAVPSQLLCLAGAGEGADPRHGASAPNQNAENEFEQNHPHSSTAKCDSKRTRNATCPSTNRFTERGTRFSRQRKRRHSTERSAEQDPDSIPRLRNGGEAASEKSMARDIFLHVGACSRLAGKQLHLPGPPEHGAAPPPPKKKNRLPPPKANTDLKKLIAGYWLPALRGTQPRRRSNAAGFVRVGPCWFCPRSLQEKRVPKRGYRGAVPFIGLVKTRPLLVQGGGAQLDL
ncbi:uncharacterized protein Tco025E_09833 [Trypanosoma conorhini]|uniref:Uncharacterized protein n=1 Tax=Trypanosoma conorhini TaxID=83891 RepID=A0A3R7LF20_9TRYP|nr:uncharacterized protein Tco025E_09833 [Trypanosoma conorhini]RNE96007.1 hypothetical protein Tco025E_09833 [Trypanosoma conorhini]